MRKMKNSGVEWIGEIPERWEVKKLKYICYPLASGGTPDSNNDQYYCENGTNWVAINDMSLVDYVENTAKHITNLAVNEKNLKIYPKGTIIYSIYATLGHVAELSKPACINQALLALSIRDKNFNKSYFKYSLNAMKEYVLAFSSGNTQFNLNAQKVRNFILSTPIYETQQRIATYLDKKCCKIEETIQNQQQVIEKLKAYKQSLITEAVTGKVKIQNGIACGEYESYKDSGVEYLGSVPSSWTMKRLRYIGTCQNGISKGGEYFGSGYPFVSYGDVYKNLVLPENVSGLIESTEEEQNNYSVQTGDIFFTRTSETIEEVGFTSVCLKTMEKATFAGFVIRVRPFTDEIIPDYSKYYFSSDAHRRFFVKEMNLVTRASLSQDLLKRLPVLIPSKDEQKEIADYLDKKCTAIDSAIEQKQKLIEKLTEYKKSLIYECVTGKKEV